MTFFVKMRKLRKDLLSLLPLLTIMAAMWLMFPREAFEYREISNPSVSGAPDCQLITLSANDEARLLATVRISWNSTEQNSKYEAVNLISESLPDMEFAPVAAWDLPATAMKLPVVKCPINLIPVSQTTEEVEIFSPEPVEAVPPAFSRDSLLQLDDSLFEKRGVLL